MVKKLVIVESPAKAKTIGKFLGSTFKVVASVGHIRDLPKSQLGIDIENNFEPKYINIRGKAKVINDIKKEVKKSSKVYLATDPDREGEAISWHLCHILDIPREEKCRVVFHEITKNAIKNSIKMPRQIDTDLVDAQQARRVLDRLVGYKISPLLWQKVKKGLSAGRVQSVALRLITEREGEIEAFQSEEYWSLTVELTEKAKGKSFNAKLNYKEKITSKEQMDKILKDLKGESFIVNEVKQGERIRKAPLPFITSTLQQEAARKLGFTAKRTMMISQQLYEGLEIKGEGTIGLITYIRTDSTRLSEEALQGAKEYITKEYGEAYVNPNPGIKKEKKKTQDAHEAIRPTTPLKSPSQVEESLTKDQLKLYGLIWDRFLASQMKPAVYDTISMDIAAGDYSFRASGSSLKFPGFMAIYIEGQDDESLSDEGYVPLFDKGTVLKLLKTTEKQHFTQPPPRYTEAMLVKELEEKGIGRPSTYAPIIETLTERGYVTKEAKRFMPTYLGKLVCDILVENFDRILNTDFTASLENQLDRIEDGDESWKRVISEFYSSFEHDLEKAKANIQEIEIKDEESDVPCEKCGRMMVYKHGRFGKFLACPGFPDCRNTKRILEEVGVDCPLCDGTIVARSTKKGRRFYGCSNYPQCEFTSWFKPEKEKCPNCQGIMVQKNSKKHGKILKCINEQCGVQKVLDREE